MSGASSASELGFPQVGGSVASGFEPLVETFAETLALSTSMGERCISASPEMWLLTYGEGKPR